MVGPNRSANLFVPTPVEAREEVVLLPQGADVTDSSWAAEEGGVGT